MPPRWTFYDNSLRKQLAPLLQSSDWLSRATLVKQNTRRSVHHLMLDENEQLACYVKHDHPRSPRNRIKNLWRCKAGKEFEALANLDHAGIPVTPPVAWGRNEADSYLITREIPGILEFYDLWNNCRKDAQTRRLFLDGLIRFMHKLTTAGVAHPDMHTGNVLGRHEKDSIKFHLVDVYGVKIRRKPSLRNRLALWAWLRGWSTTLAPGEWDEFLGKATNLKPDQARDFWRRVQLYQTRLANQFWTSRQKKLLHSSSICAIKKTDAGIWLLLKPFSLETAAAALEQHLNNFDEQKNILKVEKKRRLSRVASNSESLVVKEFRHPGPWGRFRPDCRSWLNTYRLKMHGIPAAQCRAWLKHADGRGFLFLQDMGDTNLHVALKNAVGNMHEQRLLLRHGARVAAGLHQARIVHGDLKLSNIMIEKPAGSSTAKPMLIDSDDVRFNQRMTLGRRAKNLGQMLNTFPKALGKWPRLRFLVHYRKETGLNKKQLKKISKNKFI